MVCPRCDANLKYGAEECPFCGLRFKYKEREKEPSVKKSAVPKCKRSTAAILAYLFGFAGVHNFYLGYFWRGAVRLILYVAVCGLLIGPAFVQLVETGIYRLTFDYLTIIGLVVGAVLAVSWAISIVEFVYLLLGRINSDAKGLPLI